MFLEISLLLKRPLFRISEARLYQVRREIGGWRNKDQTGDGRRAASLAQFLDHAQRNPSTHRRTDKDDARWRLFAHDGKCLFKPS